MDELPSHIPPVQIIPDLKDARPLAMSMQMRPSGTGRVFGAYTIHPGLYSQYPLAHQRTFKKLGQVFVAVYDGSVVAFCRLGLSWAHPEHRGKGLGPELLADFIESRGGPIQHYSNKWPSKLTAQAIKMHNRAHQILLARGRVK